jgi:hypothetical protein
VRTFRTYATARTYSFSTPNSTPRRTNPKVTASPTQKRADHVLSREALRDAVRERDTRITALAGQLYDADGIHLVDENARLRDLIATTNANLQRAQLENANLQRSLDAARANIKRERERNVAQLFPEALSGGTPR